MTRIELLTEMEEALKDSRTDLFTDLIREGIFSANILFHREVFLYFDKERILGKKVTKSVLNTSEKFEMTEDSVYKIIRKFRT